MTATLAVGTAPPIESGVRMRVIRKGAMVWV